MDAKLTLNMDREVAGKAKKYARSKGRSLSDLVEDYLRFLTSQMDSEELQISPGIKSLLGSIKVPEGFDYKKELSGRLNEKYLDK
jgi:hypothetical protein